MAIEIKSYRVYLTNGPNFAFGAILLYNTEGQYFARISCLATNASQPTQGSNGIYYLHYPRDQYQDIIDLLRNEGPVYLWPQTDTFPYASLGTSPEPVGEGELIP